jgi:hypothetical protein
VSARDFGLAEKEQRAFTLEIANGHLPRHIWNTL